MFTHFKDADWAPWREALLWELSDAELKARQEASASDSKSTSSRNNGSKGNGPKCSGAGSRSGATWRLPVYLHEAMRRHLYPRWHRAHERGEDVDIRRFAIVRARYKRDGLPLNEDFLRWGGHSGTDDYFTTDGHSTEGVASFDSKGAESAGSDQAAEEKGTTSSSKAFLYEMYGGQRYIKGAACYGRPPDQGEVMRCLMRSFIAHSGAPVEGYPSGHEYCDVFIGRLRVEDLPYATHLGSTGVEPSAEVRARMEAIGTEGLKVRTTTFLRSERLRRDFQRAAAYAGFDLSTLYSILAATWLTSEAVDVTGELGDKREGWFSDEGLRLAKERISRQRRRGGRSPIPWGEGPWSLGPQ